MNLCREMSMIAVSHELGEPDNNLWRVFHHYVKNEIIDSFNFIDVKRVCVDETAKKRGHSYISIFTDYDTGKVLFVTDGRGKEVFELFYGWLWDNGGHPGSIELFSMDMSKSYIAGRKENFGRSEVVYDRFHKKKCLNKAVNTVRKDEVVNIAELKKTKYIWLKNENNLSEKQRQMLYGFLQECSLDTAHAYLLKQGFDQLWNVQLNAIEPLFNAWIDKAIKTGLKPILKFVNTLYEHYNGIINSIKTGITNAVSEGINSLVQFARTRARGYRNKDNFIAMVYYLGNK
jgi:transposase